MLYYYMYVAFKLLRTFICLIFIWTIDIVILLSNNTRLILLSTIDIVILVRS